MARGLEPECQEFVGEFQQILTEVNLRAFEHKNRDKIAGMPFAVRDLFDKHWEKLTGKGYYQPITTAPVVMPFGGQNNKERSDPKSRDYCARIVFSSVSWQKIPRRKIGKKFVDLFNLKGVEQDTQEERPIYQNLDGERLKTILGVKAKDKIVEQAKTIDHGELEGPFEIKVEGYWLVTFSPQQSPNDTKDVRLMWEGQCLIVQRMKEVVLPGFYIEVADHALRDHYTQTPQEGRKKVGTIQEYPYTVIREATRQEYLEMKAKGDEIQREKLRREENL